MQKKRNLKSLAVLIVASVTMSSINAQTINIDGNTYSTNEEFNGENLTINHLLTADEVNTVSLISELARKNQLHVDSETGAIKINANIMDVLRSRGIVTEAMSRSSIKTGTNCN